MNTLIFIAVLCLSIRYAIYPLLIDTFGFKVEEFKIAEHLQKYKGGAK